MTTKSSAPTPDTQPATATTTNRRRTIALLAQTQPSLVLLRDGEVVLYRRTRSLVFQASAATNRLGDDGKRQHLQISQVLDWQELSVFRLTAAYLTGWDCGFGGGLVGLRGADGDWCLQCSKTRINFTFNEIYLK